MIKFISSFWSKLLLFQDTNFWKIFLFFVSSVLPWSKQNSEIYFARGSIGSFEENNAILSALMSASFYLLTPSPSLFRGLSTSWRFQPTNIYDEYVVLIFFFYFFYVKLNNFTFFQCCIREESRPSRGPRPVVKIDIKEKFLTFTFYLFTKKGSNSFKFYHKHSYYFFKQRVFELIFHAIVAIGVN